MRSKMTLQQVKTQDSLDCSHCESLGEISFDSLQRQQRNIPIRVWVRNLPEGISESGLRNLFLTVGEPLSIAFNPKNKTALVEFKLMNEVELAMRDLHCKPPYNLKVTLAVPRPKNEAESTKQPLEDKLQDMLVNVTQLGPSTIKDCSQQKHPASSKDEHLDKILNEVECQIKNIIKILGYDPSLRMRQNKLDFKTDSKCVSKGRGYLYMGDKDRFIGGLEKFQYSSKNSRAKDKMSFSCENCTALTTKMCGSCSTSFCSKECLSSSTVNHRIRCLGRRSEAKHAAGDYGTADLVEHSPKHPFPEVPLKSGSNVVMASYFTTVTVFVRPCDNPWEEKFNKLCSDVALEALKGRNLEKTPSFRDLVIARYYEDLCFYRAQVCGVDENKIIVFFIDFGNTQETRLEDLKVLPARLKSLPGFAVKVQLKDVSEISSIDAVNYYNKLTAESTPLILNFDNSTDEVVLTEKDSKASINETVFKLALPSWKKDSSAFSKTGEIFYLDSIRSQKLEVGKTYNLIVSHFDEKEFLESEVFWVTDQDTDEFFHASSEMLLRITQYCEFLKGDCYLPRTNELCLAKENGKWHRCVNLKSHKTTCCLFFLDDGHSSFIATNNIRKMIQDFTELPSQSVCCTLPDDPKLKNNQKFQESVVSYLKSAVGQTITSVRVLKLMGDAYCLSLPDIKCIATSPQSKTC